MPYFCGLDWGSTGHAVCVVDETGAVVLRFEISHDAAGLAELRQKLNRLAPAADIPLAIERPSGLIVDALVEAGHPVVPIYPNALKACRPRYRAAGGKSDPGDAFLLADILRTDGHRLRPLVPCCEEIKALRALTRGRDDLVAPSGLPSPTACAVCWRASGPAPPPSSPILTRPSRSPSCSATQRPSRRRASAKSASRPSWRATPTAVAARPTELLARLHAAPRGLAAEAEAEAKGEMVRALAAVLDRLVSEIAKLTSRIERTVAEMPDGQIVMSFPRAGRICAAQILAELGNVRQRFPTADQLAAEAGVRPVTHASGKSRGVVFRWACNHRLRAAVTCFADNSRHTSPWAAEVYRRARARGCDHLPTPSASSGAHGTTPPSTTQTCTTLPPPTTRRSNLDTGCLTPSAWRGARRGAAPTHRWSAPG